VSSGQRGEVQLPGRSTGATEGEIRLITGGGEAISTVPDNAGFTSATGETRE